MPSLAGKVIVVTGASRGIGRATSLSLAKRGARLVVASRDLRELENLKGLLDSFGVEALVVPTDVRMETDVASLARKASRKFGQIDALINNAGVAIYRSLMQTETEDWNTIIDTNLRGVYLCTRHFLPLMLENGSGHIINVASQAGLYGIPNLVAYSASKFGVVGFSEALRREIADSGVKVSYICPGYTETDLVKIFPEEVRRNSKKATPESVAEEIVKILETGHVYPQGNSIGKRILRRLREIWTN